MSNPDETFIGNIKVYEATGDISFENGKFQLPCRVMLDGADDFTNKVFTFDEQQAATDFKYRMDNIEDFTKWYMQELINELQYYKEMLDSGEPYIMLGAADEMDDDGDDYDGLNYGASKRTLN